MEYKNQWINIFQSVSVNFRPWKSLKASNIHRQCEPEHCMPSTDWKPSTWKCCLRKLEVALRQWSPQIDTASPYLNSQKWANDLWTPATNFWGQYSSIARSRRQTEWNEWNRCGLSRFHHCLPQIYGHWTVILCFAHSTTASVFVRFEILQRQHGIPAGNKVTKDTLHCTRQWNMLTNESSVLKGNSKSKS